MTRPNGTRAASIMALREAVEPFGVIAALDNAVKRGRRHQQDMLTAIRIRLASWMYCELVGSLENASVSMAAS